MRKLVGVVIVGFVGLVSLFQAVTAMPEVFAFIADQISALNALLDYQAEVLVGVSALVIASWAFDMERARAGKPRAKVLAVAVLGTFSSLALLATSFDRLDPDWWPEIAVAQGTALEQKHHAGAIPQDKSSGEGGIEHPKGGTENEGPTTLATVGSETGASKSSKGFDSGAAGACTCPGSRFTPGPTPTSGGESGGGGQVEEDFFDEGGAIEQEAAEEQREATEEAAEEQREAAEEAQWAAEEAAMEAEMGF